jgi:hypothetical protein
MILRGARRIAGAMSFIRVMMVLAHKMSGEALRLGVDAGATRLFDFGLGVSTMRRFTGSLLPRLGNVGGAFGQILSMLLLLVNDFLVVRYISWIGHG